MELVYLIGDISSLSFSLSKDLLTSKYKFGIKMYSIQMTVLFAVYPLTLVAICEANINLKALYSRIYKKDSNREVIEAQWISMTHPASSGVQGEVYASFEILTAEEARAYAAGTLVL